MKTILLSLLFATALWATVYGSLRGIVHDPDHRPVPGARVTLKSVDSDYSMNLTTNDGGVFESASVPVGAYQVSVTRDGFASAFQSVVVVSGSAPVLHFQLVIGAASLSTSLNQRCRRVPKASRRLRSSAARKSR